MTRFIVSAIAFAIGLAILMLKNGLFNFMGLNPHHPGPGETNDHDQK